MNDILDFSGKQILITGGSSGIGKETSILLSKYGARIVIMDKQEFPGVPDFLHGTGHRYYASDLKNVYGIDAKIDEIYSDCGLLDGFVHCAGIGTVRPLAMSKYDFMLDVMNVNFFSFVEITRCITRKKLFNHGFNVVGISAVGAYQGNVAKTAYCSSKAAMNGAMRCLAKELAPKGIRVNTIAPGATNTGMMADYSDMAGDTGAYKMVLDRQYLGICEPIDIANVIVFLLSNQSSKITGQCIPVDAGKLSS